MPDPSKSKATTPPEIPPAMLPAFELDFAFVLLFPCGPDAFTVALIHEYGYNEIKSNPDTEQSRTLSPGVRIFHLL